mmetsp:Transcript_62136/g.189731  ORF Transcript_62136/g.189731 Transcript_62136/m.189731 type:complete len:476 (+) Transcript_62136:789-2216(+)
MVSTIVQALCMRWDRFWCWSVCTRMWLDRSFSISWQRLSTTRRRSATVAVAVADSSRPRWRRASRLCQDVSSSFAKRAMWFSRPNISSRTAFWSSSPRRDISSCMDRWAVESALSTEVTVARRRSHDASISWRRTLFDRSAVWRSSRRASKRFAVSRCQFHCSSFRAHSASTWCFMPWYRRSTSARSCARRLRSASRLATAASICELSWWLATSRADLSAQIACTSLSILASMSLWLISRCWVSRKTASSMRSVLSCSSSLHFWIDCWQSSFTPCSDAATAVTCWLRAAIWSTTTCHWNCASSSFFVSTSDFFCSISRSADTVMEACSGCRLLASAAVSSWSLRIARPATSANWRHEWPLILSCVAKCLLMIASDPVASAGTVTRRPHTCTLTGSSRVATATVPGRPGTASGAVVCTLLVVPWRTIFDGGSVVTAGLGWLSMAIAWRRRANRRALAAGRREEGARGRRRGGVGLA